ncbi:MAG: hypothetical protein JWN80_2607, partial [Microbacteriaceae bacterium]|nr:hypothetical protein [Microbacteriaceae bacterium]
YAKLGISEVKMGAKTEDPAAWTARVVKEVLPKLDQI